MEISPPSSMEHERDFDAESLVGVWYTRLRSAPWRKELSLDIRERTRTSNTPNVHSGGIQHVHSSQGHPCSCAYFKHSKCPFMAATRTSTRPKDTRARARTSNTPNVHSWRHTARPLVPRTPVLVASTSNTPKIQTRRRLVHAWLLNLHPCLRRYFMHFTYYRAQRRRTVSYAYARGTPHSCKNFKRSIESFFTASSHASALQRFHASFDTTSRQNPITSASSRSNAMSGPRR